MRAENFPRVRKIRWYRVLHVLMDGGFLFYPAGDVGIAGCVAWCLLANEIPPAGAPPGGGGVRCAALFGCCVRLCTRCAASLRMTRWVGWIVVRNFFDTKYSTVKLTDTAFCFSSHAPAPYRVILSEAAQISKIRRDNQALPHSEPRPKRGASRRDLACLNAAQNVAHRLNHPPQSLHQQFRS